MALSTINSNAITDGTIATGDIADDAVTAAKTSGVGITEADMWRVSANFANSSNGANEVLTSNWERADTDFAKIGTGLSESSGVFTFPSTGVYLVQVNAYFYPNGANSGYIAPQQVTPVSSSGYSSVIFSAPNVSCIVPRS